MLSQKFCVLLKLNRDVVTTHGQYISILHLHDVIDMFCIFSWILRAMHLELHHSHEMGVNIDMLSPCRLKQLLQQTLTVAPRESPDSRFSLLSLLYPLHFHLPLLFFPLLPPSHYKYFYQTLRLYTLVCKSHPLKYRIQDRSDNYSSQLQSKIYNPCNRGSILLTLKYSIQLGKRIRIE